MGKPQIYNLKGIASAERLGDNVSLGVAARVVDDMWTPVFLTC
jgi:hypothetical protein